MRRLCSAFAQTGLVVTAVLGAACVNDTDTLKRNYVVSGDAYMAQRQYDAAIIEFRNAVQQDDGFAEARQKLVRAYVSAGDTPRAVAEAVRTAELLPDDDDAQLEAANLLILAGHFADAQDRANNVVARNPRNIRAIVAVGNALAGLRDLDAAVSQLEEAVRLDPARASTYTNLATLQLGAGRVEEAEAAYKQAVSKAPDSLRPLLSLSLFYWLTSRPGEAEVPLRRALAVAPRDLVANRFASVYYQATGRPAQAEQYFRAAVDADGSSRARLSLAEYYVGASRTDEAVAVLRTLTNDRVVGSEAKVRLAMIDYSNGRVEAANEAVDAILRVSPREVLALIAKANILFDQGRFEDALGQTHQAVAADHLSAAAHFAQGKVLAAMQRIDSATEAFNTVLRLNPRAASAEVELSKLHLRTGAADAAVASARAAIDTEPRRVDARLVLARGLINRGDHVQAEAILSELVAAFPNSAVVHAQMGWLNVAKDDAAGARTAFERALRVDPVQIDALSGILGLDMLARRLDDVRGRLEMVVPQAPRSAPLLTLTGRMYSLMGDFASAEQMLIRAITADANFVQAYTLLGRLYLQQRRIEEARIEFERRAQREPRPVAALTMIGLIYELQNRTDAARRVFEQVIGLDPNAPVAANNLAWIYAEHGGNLDAALQLAQRARRALPESGETNDTLGWIYLKKELFGLSISAFRQAVEREPKNPTFQYHLGLAYARSGDHTRAKQTLEAAFRLRPEFEGAEDARRLLAGL